MTGVDRAVGAFNSTVIDDEATYDPIVNIHNDDVDLSFLETHMLLYRKSSVITCTNSSKPTTISRQISSSSH